jgi:protein-L-isoaspartate(D-aspartate) O-methyltransferase
VFGRKKDLEDLRERMIRNHIEARGVTEPRVLEALRRLPREEFVPEDLRDKAYEDRPLPIGAEQTISQPYITALMTQALDCRPFSKVLEIGTGSGYQTALLSILSKQVYTIETIPDLAKKARERLERLGYASNVTFLIADGSIGLDSKSPFDRIVVTAAAPSVPTPLLEQLGPEGILVLPVGDRWGQNLLKVKKTEDRLQRENLCPCVFVPLIGLGGFPD